MTIAEKLTSTAWAAAALQSLKQELDELHAGGSLIIPQEPGGWWHQYVCPTHHAELLFDPAERDAHAFACPHGCRIEGDAYRGAWLVFKHQSMARYALQAAAIYAGTKEPAYADLAKQILVSYAAQFPQYPVHPDAQPWMLKGRAFHQALTEAIWATTLLRAYVLLQDEGVSVNHGEQQAIDTFLVMLEASMTQYRHILIHERNNPTSNYTAWLNAALCCVYAVRGQKDRLVELIEDEGGWRHHLSIGVHPDQLEYEGSTYYHVFVLRAYLISAEMAERFGIDLYHAAGEQGQSLEGMFDVLVGLADDQGVLPALHDGPLERLPFAREIAEIMEIGLTKYGKAEYAPILGEAHRQMEQGQRLRNSLEALVYGTGDNRLDERMPARSSLLLADSGFVVGRTAGSGLSFLADFGPHGGSHGHYDKLHVSLYHPGGAIMPDMGMVPYGSPLRKQWFAHTASHNTVSVGGRSQTEHEGRCRRFAASDHTAYVWLQSDQAYEGGLLERHLLLTDEWMLDWFEVQLSDEQTIDWWMHSLTPPEAVNARCNGCGDTSLGFKEDGYSMLKLLGRYELEHGIAAAVASSPSSDSQHAMASAGAPAVFTCRYMLDTAVEGVLHQSALIFTGDALYKVQTPGTSNDPSQALQAVLHRTHGRNGRFIHIYKLGEAAGVSWQGVSEGTAAKPKLIIGTSHTEAVCQLDPAEGLRVTWREQR
ncbi:heparinase [Paenibacillus xerothermodurans]|uniref:Heparinase n=2 Tax=Paenibacillus xerothermodurans TaxID=1977292 RepID=A0A2W1NEG7_PAEXE|nr:heparinase [Paenibacillus xerothermodurans]